MFPRLSCGDIGGVFPWRIAGRWRKIWRRGRAVPRGRPSGGEPPVKLYDTSGPYTDNSVAIDIQTGLASVRRDWILARGDVEEYGGRVRQPEDDGLKRAELIVCAGHSIAAA